MKRRIVVLVAVVLTMVGLIRMIDARLSSTRSTVNDNYSSFQLVVSSYGIPGTARTKWTISSDGTLVNDRIAASEEITSRRTVIPSSQIDTLREALPDLVSATGTFTGNRLDTHLWFEVTLADGSVHRTLLKDGAMPDTVMRFLVTLNSVLGSEYQVHF
jgi:hypothetical protein